MTRSEAVYDNLLRLLAEFVEETPRRLAIINALEEEQQATLIDARDTVASEAENIAGSKEAGDLHTDFGSLIDAINLIAASFPQYTFSGERDIRLLLNVVERLSNALEGEDPSLETEFDESEFNLKKLVNGIKEDHFIEIGVDDVSDTLILVNTNHIESFGELLGASSLHSDMYFHLLSNVGNQNTLLKSSQYVLVSKKIGNSSKKIRATIVLAVVKSGKIAHRRVKHNAPISIPALARIVVGSDYQQFEDTLVILSEYNDESELLGKYLRLYQVFENFMYKFPLVGMERRHGGTVFSIRDFQRMYKNLPDNENDGLKALFTELCSILRDSGPPPITYTQHIRTSFANLQNNQFNGSTDNLDKFFRILNLNKGNMTCATFANADIVQNFSKLVYSVRNSIVHNRETEFHLSHETLSNHVDIGDTAKVVISGYLLPILEEIAYSVITRQNDKIWFQRDKLTLWKK